MRIVYVENMRGFERICSFVECGELWEKGIDNDERMIYICF